MSTKPPGAAAHRSSLAFLFFVPVAISLLLVLVWLTAPSGQLFAPSYSRVVFDREGRLLGAVISADEQWRFPASESPLPEKYVTALIEFEDSRFYRHPGVDPLAIGRALLSNVEAGEIVSGGSTITMQVARLARGNRPRTLAQKIAEASLALRLELALDKTEVIELFAANAPFGGNVVGIEAASWRFFGRPLRDLTWAEAALLAVLPNSPALIHVSQRRPELTAKRDRLLERLHGAGALDEESFLLALAEPVPQAPRAIPQTAPHLLQTLAAEHPDRWRFITTLHEHEQLRATEVLARHGERLRSLGIQHAAAIIVDVPTGDVLAHVGNLVPRDPPGRGDYVDIVGARRSTGSLLKPFLYAAMIDSGELLPRQIVADIPTRIGGYIPENHTRVFSGAVRADEALARSLNVPAARLLRDFGVSRFYGLLKDFGMTTFVRPADEYGIPLILGGAESTLFELTGMYASMARTVVRRDPDASNVFRPHVLVPGGETLDGGAPSAPIRASDHARRAPVSPGALYLTLAALNEVERPEELSGWRAFSSSGEVSWKTGTSYGLRDAWAIGVTDRYAVGVWVGNATGAGVPGLRGTASAGPIMFQLFELLDRGHGFLSPGGLATVRVCSDSGYLAGPDCPSTESALVPAGAHDHPACPYCRTLHLDASGAFQVTSDIYPVADMRHEKWFVLPGTMAWYYRQAATDYRTPPPFDPRIADVSQPISVEFPLPGAQVYVPVEMSGLRGSLVATAYHRDRSARLFWHLNGTYLGETARDHTMEITPPPGDHELALVDSAGHSVRVSFRVLARDP